MKLSFFLRSFVVAGLLMGAVGSVHAQTSPYISGISPSRLRPGTVVELTGGGFGSAPYEGTQVCFSSSLCTTSSNFSTFVKSWSDTLISVVVPYQDLPAQGTMSVVLPTAQGGMLLQSPAYTFSKSDPVVSGTSTKTIVPGSTVLTITGSNFQNYTAGKSTICISNNCLSDAQMATNVTSWTDTSISVRLPYVPGTTDFSVNVVVYDPLLENIQGASPSRMLTITGFHFELPPSPQVTGISPTDIYPGNTSVVLTGSGFGDSYTAGNNQICFDDRCLSDSSDISDLLVSWTPTRIEFKAPLWLALSTNSTSTVGVRVYDVVEQRFTFAQATTQVVIRQVPVVTDIVPTMDMGSSYIVKGKNFGTVAGNVTINGVPVDVLSWKDTSISYWVPDTVQSGKFRVTPPGSYPSQEVAVTVRTQPIYSKDAFTRLMWYFGSLGVEDAWKLTRGLPTVTVAVIDSGVDFTHEELQGKSWVNTREIPGNGIDDDHNGYVDDTNGWNFVTNKPTTEPTNSHGTMVSSVIAAEADNYKGLAGIAPGVRIMNLQVTTPADANFNEDYITLSSAQKAIRYAVDNGANIINLSFASDSRDPLYADLIAYAYAHNVLVVIASGNDAKDLAKTPVSPVCDDRSNPYAIGVSSVGTNNLLSSFANYGNACVDIYAPGEQIVVAAPDAQNNGRYMLSEGTSFASPIVAATAALVKSLHPDWNVAEVRAAILGSSQMHNNLPLLSVIGSVQAAKPQVTYTPDTSAQGLVSNDSTVFHSDPVPVTPVQPDTSKTPDTTPAPTVTPSTDTTPPVTFKDIPSSSVFYIPVTELSKQGVIQGYSDGTYRPLTPVNRAEFLKILVEGAHVTPDPAKYKNCFPDVTTQWFAPYVCYAKELGVVEGYPGAADSQGNRLFQPDRTINKVEALKVILTYNKIPLAQGKNSFNDAEPGSWYYAFATTAESLGLLDERFVLRPGESLSRGSMAQIIYRLEASLAAK